ncbi:MAG TPA: hypothetical protein VI197_30990 [Polyangiaceae bacterium]
MIASRPGHWGFLLLAGVLSLQCYAERNGDTDAANDTGPTGGSGGSGGSGGTAPTTGGGGTDSTTTGGPSTHDLFACGLDLGCAPICSHLGMLGDCGGAGPCVERVWSSGDSGDVVMFQSRPGPGVSQEDTLFVLLGDGRVLTQQRSRSCAGGEPNCYVEGFAWSVREQQRCEMGYAHPLEVKACRRTNLSCDEVTELLEGGAGESGGAGGAAGGAAGHAGEVAE